MPKLRHPDRIGLRLRVVLRDSVALGPGRAELLYNVGQMGSIAAAARAMGMSYRRAWMLIDETTTAFGAPVVIAASGGANGGRAELTNLGLDIVTLFRRMEETAAKALAPELDALLRLAAH